MDVDQPRHMAIGRRRPAIFLLVAAIGYTVAAIALFPKLTVDDAYITVRYAENLARHGELVYNVGEQPVEGYTGVALPVLLAGFVRLGISPILAGRAIGIAAFI